MAEKTIEYLSVSPSRITVLQCLSTSPSRPCELIEQNTFSRATLQRHLDGFSERGWVRKKGKRYRITTCGEWVLEKYDELNGQMETIEKISGIIRHIEDIPVEPELSMFEDAKLVTETDSQPHRALNYYINELSSCSTTEFHGFCPVVSPIYNDVHGPVVEECDTPELILPTKTYESLRKDPHLDGKSTGISLFTYPEYLNFGLSLLENRVFLGGYERGQLSDCLSSDSPELVDWAHDLFEYFKAKSDRVN